MEQEELSIFLDLYVLATWWYAAKQSGQRRETHLVVHLVFTSSRIRNSSWGGLTAYKLNISAVCILLQDISALDFTLDKKGEEGTLDPYGMREDYASWDVGVYASCLEVTVLPTEDNLKEFTALYKRLRYAYPSLLFSHLVYGMVFKSPPWNIQWKYLQNCFLFWMVITLGDFRGLLEILKRVEPKEMTHQQRVPFWINIYNALLLHVCTLVLTPFLQILTWHLRWDKVKGVRLKVNASCWEAGCWC